ncbi:hypothetical protein ACIBH1_28345 [Nonomuraea sp. NPDC050663]
METQFHAAPPPPPPAHGAPGWGAPHHGGHYGHHRQRSWVNMLFSS